MSSKYILHVYGGLIDLNNFSFQDRNHRSFSAPITYVLGAKASYFKHKVENVVHKAGWMAVYQTLTLPHRSS